MRKHAIDLARLGSCVLRAAAAGALALVLTTAEVAAQPNDARAELRQEFLAAWRDPGRDPAGDSPALRGYVLYPDLQSRRLRRQVGNPLHDAEVEAFLAGPAGDWQPGRLLRDAWLDALAGRGDWPRFARHYVPNGDDERACHAARAAIETAPGSAETRALALGRWLSPNSQPKACDAVFQWLRARGELTPELIEQRALLALRAGDWRIGRWLARQLPPDTAAPLQRWAQYLEAPRATIDSFIAHPQQPLDAEALADAWQRFARGNPEDARARIDKLVTRVRDARLPADAEAELLARLYTAAALGAAWSRKSWTLDLFRKVPAEGLSELGHEWRVRAALWAGEWPLARDWLREMPPELADDLRWRYWLGRALEETDDTAAAQQIYAALAEERDYYAFLAADRIGAAYRFNDTALPRDGAQYMQVDRDPHVQRSAEFREIDFDISAHREWQDAIDGRDHDWLVAAAQWAHQRELYLLSITTLAAADEWNDLAMRYPLPYRDHVERAAASEQVPPAWLYAIMRQESLFRRDAVSAANAHGLLQLLPQTAQQIARSTRRPIPSRADLFRPEVNLPLGAAYLRFVLDEFNARLVDALGAYNAGPGAMRRWIEDRRRDHDIDVWIENIPYNETRHYIARVTENIATFSYRLGDPPPTLTTLLAQPVDLP